MFRVKFPKNQQKIFFDSVRRKTGFNWTKIALLCKVHPRSVSGWAREKQLPTENSIKILCKVSELPFPQSDLVDEYWSTKKAGKIGGRNNVLKNGNPGTVDGRIKGGKNSVKVNQKLNNDFVKRKEINLPKHSDVLAELFGIILGDGHLRNGRFGITLNKFVDSDYSVYVSSIIKFLFGLCPRVYVRNNFIQIDLISIVATEFLIKNGLKTGNKVTHQVDVPLWIKKNESYSQRCVRGLIDTDGSVYLDKHKIRERNYASLCIDFTNHSRPLLNFVKTYLSSHNYNVTQNLWNIRIRRNNDVKRFFMEIGFSNIKHENKFINYFESVNGEVA